MMPPPSPASSPSTRPPVMSMSLRAARRLPDSAKKNTPIRSNHSSNGEDSTARPQCTGSAAAARPDRSRYRLRTARNVQSLLTTKLIGIVMRIVSS